MSPKIQFAMPSRRYIMLALVAIAGCKEECNCSIARISLDKNESSYDSAADSTTATQTSFNLEDTGGFWGSLIDSALQTGASTSSVPMVSMDTVIEVETKTCGVFTINSTDCGENAFVISYHDSAKRISKCFTLGVQANDAIRARIRYLTHNAPRTELIYKSPGYSGIPSNAPECDAAAGFSACIKTKADSCLINDARIY